MKKVIFYLLICVFCSFVLLGCSFRDLIAAGENITKSYYQNESVAVPELNSPKYDIDPLGLLHMAFGKNIGLFTGLLVENDDYSIYNMDGYIEYDFFDKEFEYMGESFYTYYNLCTPSDSDLIDTVEYEIYADATDAGFFINRYKAFYDTLCHEFGERNIYEVSYKELDESFENAVYSDFESLCTKISAFDNGVYYICWDNPEYQIYYQVVVDDQNTFKDNQHKFYDAYLTFIINSYNFEDGRNANPMDNIDSLVLD